MKLHYLSKMLLALTAAVGITSTAHAIDPWNMLGPVTLPSIYALEVNNTSSHVVKLSSTGFGFIAGVPAEVPANSVATYYLSEDSMRSFIYAIDSQSVSYPQQNHLHCQETEGLSTFTWDFKMQAQDVDDSNIMHNFLIHTDICMVGKCDVESNPNYSGNRGYVIMMFSDEPLVKYWLGLRPRHR